MGIPITMDILQRKVLCHVKSHDQEPNYKLFSQVYIEDNKKIKMFLTIYKQMFFCFTKQSSKLETIKY